MIEDELDRRCQEWERQMRESERHECFPKPRKMSLTEQVLAGIPTKPEIRDPSRRVALREEHVGADHRYLDAYMDLDGNLHIDGQDLGPGTAMVSSDGEYEWFEVVKAADVPLLRRVLGIPNDQDLLDALKESWSGERAHVLEAILGNSIVPVQRFIWSG